MEADNYHLESRVRQREITLTPVLPPEPQLTEVLCDQANSPVAAWCATGLSDTKEGGAPHLVVSKPAATAHFSSLPDTSTAPLPKCCRCFMMMRLLLALMA